MRKKIMFGMCIIAFFSVFITSFLTIVIMYEDVRKTTLDKIEKEARYIDSVYESGEFSDIDDLSEILSYRVTIFDNTKDINILYDTIPSENAADYIVRTDELEKARIDGHYVTSRYSDTTKAETMYYYLTLNNGEVVRVGEAISSLNKDLLSFVPWFIVISLFACLVSVFLAKQQTYKIIKPINKINIDKPTTDGCYEELYPLIRKVERQRREIKKTMALLERRQREFEIIIKNMEEGFIVIDKNGDTLTFNKAAIKLCGHEKFEIGENVFLLNRDANFYHAIENAQKGESSELEQEIDGRYCKFLISPILIDDDLKGVTIVIMDITEIHSREDMRREFTANVSHELKTPLTSISGYSEIIKAGIAKEGDIKGFAEKIYNETQRLIELVADIIKLSHLDESNGIFKKEICDVYEIAKTVSERLENTAQKAEISFTLEGESVRIKGVPNLIEETIYNLANNSIKYNNKGGNVKVQIAKLADKAVITVEDNGIGIPVNERERIFERFYRVDKSHSKETGGTGLGLSIVKHCVKIHGGNVDLESEVGKGTKVVVEI